MWVWFIYVSDLFKWYLAYSFLLSLPSLGQCPIQELKAMRRWARAKLRSIIFFFLMQITSLQRELSGQGLVTWGGQNPREALQTYFGLLLWPLVEDHLSTGGLFMTFFLKVTQILVAAIWMFSQIESSCRMSEYSTRPTAVRKEQGVVKVLLLQTRPGFFSPWLVQNGKQNICLHPLPFHFSGGADACHGRSL